MSIRPRSGVQLTLAAPTPIAAGDRVAAIGSQVPRRLLERALLPSEGHELRDSLS
jgi:hypothetical protein